MYDEIKIQLARNLYKDELSTKIFDHRLAYAKSGETTHLLDMINDSIGMYNNIPFVSNIRLLDMAKKIANAVDKQTVVIWGAGNGSNTPLQLVYEYFYTASRKPELLCCDNNRKLWGTTRAHHNPNMRIPIISPNTVKKMATDKNVYVVIALGQYHSIESVYDQLKGYGFSDERIVKQTGFYEYYLGKMYFDKKIMFPRNDEFFVDIGAYDMSNSLDFIRWCDGNYSGIVAFEADSVSFEKCKAIIAEHELEKCEVINNAVYSENTEISFLSAPDGEYGGSRIDQSAQNTIKAVSLDSFFKTNKVTIIKMDIEGAELNALVGAKETIRKYTPRLAVSAYHKPFDIVELPLFISQEIDSRYKFYLRHHTFGIWDTVLYATT